MSDLAAARSGSHLNTLRYWFDVEALTYPDLPHPGKARSHLLCASDAMPWARAAGEPVPQDHKYFVYFGLIEKSALESELADMFQVELGGESYGGNQLRDAKGKTFLCAIEVAFDGTPIVSSLQLAAFCIAFAARKTGKRSTCSALLAVLKQHADALLSNGAADCAAGCWFEQLIVFLTDALAWTPVAPREQLCVQRITLLDRNGKKLPWAPAMDPVNSFHLDDLERICLAAEDGQDSKQIGRYLGANNLDGRERASARIDITAFDAVNEALSPHRFPLGRWPNRFPLFLMQQVAVNKSLEMLADGGLFSINGPPGTGKTTLLMDIIAARIVDRAMILAEFGDPAHAFARSQAVIDYPVSKSGNVARGACFLIDQRLLDCGIVVASANNKAVENITLDLPNLDQVYPQPLLFDGAPFDYFACAAEAILNPEQERQQQSKQQDKIGADPDEQDDAPGGGVHEQMACWGLVSVPLGSMKNCKMVARRLGKFGQSGLASQLDRMPALDWNAARAQFNAALAKVVALQHAIARHDVMLPLLRAAQDGLAFARSAFAVADMRHHVAQGALDGAGLRLLENERLLALNLSERARHRLEWPWWRRLLARLLRRHQFVCFTLRRRQLADDCGRLRDVRSTLLRARVQADAAAAATRAALVLQDAAVASGEVEVIRLEGLQGELRKQLGAAAFDPAQFRQWSVDQQQLSLPRSNAVVHAARADVFVAAMHLHKAFLKNAGKAFETNFRLALAMLSQEAYLQPHLATMAPHLWATFFLAVPVASSTFASMSRCFRDLGEGQIGLLLVDEAGQAVPSHALGAIWRSKRALIVGDPLQVEPVIRMDSKLDLGMLNWHGAPEEHLLTRYSAQHLADRANRYGAQVARHDGGELWVGAPLRVHRRCAEPMFSLSNAIAYNGKMVFGVQQDAEEAATRVRPLLGMSCWHDFASGDFVDHFSASEGAAAVAIVIAYANNGWVSKSDGLPDLFLISPFKSVAQALTKALIDSAALWAEHKAGAIEEKTLSAWLKERVGTVHTFQGNECETVVFVLGGKTRGARNWAGSKPNIINVAVTRARRRLYVIGDRQAWSQTVFGEQLAQAVA